MNHRSKVKKLGKDLKHKRSLLRNLSTSLIRRGRVQTTRAKGKALRSFVEKIITRSKKDTLHNRREIYKDIKDKKVLKKLFEEIGKRYDGRPGGYTRTYKLQQRKGDASYMCLVELLPEQISEGTEEVSTQKK